MNRIYIVILLMSAFTANVSAQDTVPAPDKPAGLEFANLEHDFGEIGEREGKVSYRYEFTNNSDSPLIIAKIITSCKCVEAVYPKRPVPAGGKGVITVTYNPRKQQGVFRKAIQVYTNDAQKLHIIIAKGEVIP